MNKETDKAIFKACTEFRGGVGKQTDGHCGAYSAGVMFLSSIIGREKENFATSEKIRERCCELVDKLHSYFINEFGSVICRDIQLKKYGKVFYLANDEEFQEFDDEGYHDPGGGCDVTVSTVAQWIATIAEEEEVFTRPQPPLTEPMKLREPTIKWLKEQEKLETGKI
jgi:hypothetical protein